MSVKLEHYTTDNICLAMGLGRFSNAERFIADGPVYRVLLTPSFDPELCLTCSPETDGGALVVTALLERFWQNPSRLAIPCAEETIHIDVSDFSALSSLFEEALRSKDKVHKSLVLDGMGTVIGVIAPRSMRVRLHVNAHAEATLLVKQLILLAWSRCRLPRTKNALATAGRYVGHQFPLEAVEPIGPKSTLAVLGEPREKEEVLKALRGTHKS
jgi:hypothetical protein